MVSTNRQKLLNWLELGKIIPLCINTGCTKQVSIRHWAASKVSDIPSLKTECSRCSNARLKNRNIEGVVFHKKHYCENQKNVLGFQCPCDPKLMNDFPPDVFHMDHLNGNHEDNSLQNVQTSCSICHTRKGKENNDFNSHKMSSRSNK